MTDRLVIYLESHRDDQKAKKDDKEKVKAERVADLRELLDQIVILRQQRDIAPVGVLGDLFDGDIFAAKERDGGGTSFKAVYPVRFCHVLEHLLIRTMGKKIGAVSFICECAGLILRSAGLKIRCELLGSNAKYHGSGDIGAALRQWINIDQIFATTAPGGEVVIAKNDI